MSDEAKSTGITFSPALITLVLSMCAGSNLIFIWSADVYARGSGVIFLLWLSPLCWVWARELRKGSLQPNFLLLLLSLLACLIGVVGSLNIARHVSLGLAIGGQTTGNYWKWLWLAGILSWLPATGWLARDIPGNGWPLRFFILCFSLIASVRWWRGARI